MVDDRLENALDYKYTVGPVMKEYMAKIYKIIRLHFTVAVGTFTY